MTATTIILTLLLISGILYLVRKYSINQVEGSSMYPTFYSGQWILVKKSATLTVDNVYVFDSPLGIPCLKRLHYIAVSPTDGKLSLFFVGDNLEDSIDSRSFGFIDPSKVIGQVVKFKEEIRKWNL